MKTSSPSCLWRLVFSEEKTSYLFGTIHLPVDSVVWNKRYVYECISESDHYFGEMDLDEMAKTGMKGGNVLPKGMAISDLFSTIKSYNKVRNAIKKSFQVDIELFSHLKPLLFQHLLDIAISGGEAGIMDQELLNYAKSCGKPIGGLETFKDQLNILNKIDLDYQLKLLKEIASNTKAYHKRIKQLIKLYSQQDIRKLYLTSVKAAGRYRNLMIYERNGKMADRIVKLDPGKYFISLGVGHLYGNKGLLALLKREGVKMVPLSEKKTPPFISNNN